MKKSLKKQLPIYAALVLVTSVLSIGLFKTFFGRKAPSAQETQPTHAYTIDLAEIKTVKPGETFSVSIKENHTVSPEYQKWQLSYDKRFLELKTDLFSANSTKGLMGAPGERVITFAVTKDIFDRNSPEAESEKLTPIVLWHPDPAWLFTHVMIEQKKGGESYEATIDVPYGYTVFGIKIVNPEIVEGVSEVKNSEVDTAKK